MPGSRPIFLDPEGPRREITCNLRWNGKDVKFLVDTHGKIRVQNRDDLSVSEKEFFEKVEALATRIHGSSEREVLLQRLQSAVDIKKQTSSASTAREIVDIIPRSEDPYDQYWISRRARLPTSFSRAVPAFNNSMQLLSSFFLLPGLTDSFIGMLIVLAICVIAFLLQLFSEALQQRIGVTANRMIQDVISASILSVSTFSSLRAISDILLGRGQQMFGAEENKNVTVGTDITSFVLAGGGTIGTWFIPPIGVMGHRVAAEADNILRQCEEAKGGSARAVREKAMADFREYDKPFANRFFTCRRQRAQLTDYDSDNRMLMSPTIVTVAKRSGRAIVSAAQLSKVIGINPLYLQPALLLTTLYGIPYALINQRINITLGKRTSCSLAPLSERSPRAAWWLRASSELTNVVDSSIINPSIAFFFVFNKLLAFANANGLSVAIPPLAQLAAAIVLNVPSLISNLSSRARGIDPYEGWPPSHLSRVIAGAQNTALRSNLERYLGLMLHGIHHDIRLDAPAAVLLPRHPRRQAAVASVLPPADADTDTVVTVRGPRM